MVRTTSEASSREAAYTVAGLTRELKQLVEGRFPVVTVEGEVANARRSTRGHLYFTLRDQSENASLPCVMWRGLTRRLDFEPADGMKLLAHGRLEIYPPHGNYKLVAEGLRRSGLGELLARLEELKKRLAAEGLFEEAHKRPLPALPRRIGIVTAPTGAAVRDLVTTIRNRFPARMLLYPAQVQGEGAAESIARGVERLGAHPEVDVVVVGRGGGSIEDLWAFNEERVVRAIAGCPKPVVSAVGHEVDSVLSDLAADVRAPTPTAAGERVVPAMTDLRYRLDHAVERMERHVLRRLRDARTRLDARAARLPDPRRLLSARQQQLEDLATRLEGSMRRRFALARERRADRVGRLRNLHPRHRLRAGWTERRYLADRMERALRAELDRRRQRLAHLRSTLDALSPVRNLERGYAIVRDPQERVLRTSEGRQEGDPLEVLLHRGALDVRVDRVRSRNPFEPERS